MWLVAPKSIAILDSILKPYPTGKEITMGGDHGHGHGVPKVPDWQIYRVKDVPKLVEVEKLLASQGLKDPWLRNEVWRYQEFGTFKSRTQSFFFRGFKWGFGALLVAIAVEKGLEQFSPSHGHHKEGAHGHH